MPLTCASCGRKLPDGETVCPDDGTPLDPMTGVVLSDRYRVGVRLGEGGIGTVFEAEHVTLGRAMAVKVLRRELAGMKDLLARFDREARALSKLSHTNIVAVTDFGVWEGLPYLAMELVRGESLADAVAQGPLGTDRSVGIVRQVLSALVYAHGEGVIHRDLKPNNVMLVEQPGIRDLVKILDFGLAKFVSGTEMNDVSITKEGSVFGTPAYMAPEQVAGEKTDERSDLYAVGLMLFECLTGRRPFEVDSRAEVMRAHLTEAPPQVSQHAPEGTIPEDLDALVSKALAKKRDERHQSAEEMLRALDESVGAQPTSLSSFELGRPPSQRVIQHQTTRAASARAGLRLANRPVRIGLAAAGLLVLAGGALLVWPGEEPPPRRTEAPRFKAAETPEPRPPTAIPRVPARDPWAGDVPAELLKLRDDMEKNAPGAVRRAKVYARDHDDPRAHILVGHAYSRKTWLGDAIERYRLALRRDPSARGEPSLLPALIDLLGTSRAREASDLVVEYWGSEAAPGLAKATVEHSDADAAHGAIALLDRLGESARVDHVEVALADLRRAESCQDKQAALARLRGRREPRIAAALGAVAREDREAARCLGPALDAAIREAGGVSKTR